MKTLIVGGNFGDIPKESGVIRKMTEEFNNPEVINGGSDMPNKIDRDLIIWMPNISNESPKQYPIKSKGNVLICSKVMREGYTDIDAVSRIFNMRGNAVIAIYPGDIMRFKLLDALCNSWYDGSDITELCKHIKDIYKFTKDSIRVNSIRRDIDIEPCEEFGFIQINKKLSEHIQTSCGKRFFGNISTRCSKLFPSMRSGVGVYVSPRNKPKDSLKGSDMIHCRLSDDGDVLYTGGCKPSVDTPIQLKLYKNHPNVNYMIHGHAFIKGARTTDNYYPCGDLREYDEINDEMYVSSYGCVNLKNHGFIIWGSTISSMIKVINDSEFYYER